MQTDLSVRHWFALGLLGLGFLLCPGCSGRAVAEHELMFAILRSPFQPEKHYPTVFHYLYDRSKQFLAEQERRVHAVPRLVRKLCFATTAEDRREEQQERALVELLIELRETGMRMRAATPLLGEEGPDTNFKAALQRLDSGLKKKPDGRKK